MQRQGTTMERSSPEIVHCGDGESYDLYVRVLRAYSIGGEVPLYSYRCGISTGNGSVAPVGRTMLSPVFAEEGSLLAVRVLKTVSENGHCRWTMARVREAGPKSGKPSDIDLFQHIAERTAERDLDWCADYGFSVFPQQFRDHAAGLRRACGFSQRAIVEDLLGIEGREPLGESMYRQPVGMICYYAVHGVGVDCRGGSLWRISEMRDPFDDAGLELVGAPGFSKTEAIKILSRIFQWKISSQRGSIEDLSRGEVLQVGLARSGPVSLLFRKEDSVLQLVDGSEMFPRARVVVGANRPGYYEYYCLRGRMDGRYVLLKAPQSVSAGLNGNGGIWLLRRMIDERSDLVIHPERYAKGGALKERLKESLGLLGYKLPELAEKGGG